MTSNSGPNPDQAEVGPHRRKVYRRLLRDRRHYPLVPIATILLCVLVGIAGLSLADSLQEPFERVALDANTFFARFLLASITLFVLMAGLTAAGMWRRRGSPFLLAAALATVIATLLAAEAWRPPGSSSPDTAREVPLEEVNNWSTVAYLLFTEHRAMLLTALFIIVASILTAYYIVRGLLTVQFEGTGLQIRLPGQTVYHVPVFPQTHWQNTFIHLTEGDEVSVEISGLVSPGALQGLRKLEEQRKGFLDVIKGKKTPDQYHAEFADIIWPYTGPEGYKREWYHEPYKRAALRNDPIYRKDDFYQEDPCLTVRGLPHNVVVGIIRGAGESEPRKATLTQPGYEYSNPKDQEQLICLSSGRYPIRFEAPRTGELWVVINDVDEVRWDNTGLFFIKVIHHK
jgi:hypothetical protein